MFNWVIEFMNRWYHHPFKDVFEDWNWIFSYTKKYKKFVFLYAFFGVFSSTTALISSVLSKYVIDIITGYHTDKLILLIFLMAFSSFFSIISSSLVNRISTKVSIFIKNDIEADIFKKIVDTDWLSISKYSNGDLLSRFITDTSTVSSNAINWLPSVFLTFYTLITTFAIVLYYDPIMALLAFISAPLMMLISKSVINRQRKYNEKVREVSAGQMTFQAETFYNFDTIKSFGILDMYIRKLKDWQTKYRNTMLDLNKFTIQTTIFLQLSNKIASFIAFLYCLYRLWSHDITYGTMAFFLGQRSSLVNAFNSLVSFVPSFLTSSVSAHRVRELVELPKEVHIEQSKELEPYKEHGLIIQMDDVNYSYLEGKRVITDSDFIASPGEIVALVGPSGEGKTTMIRLILGLIHPKDGSVTIRSLTGESVPANADTRHLFAYVPQGNSILSGTIADNMRMAKEDATDDEIINALEIACAWDFVSKLEDRINSKVGERGKGLSEGQAQRIAIARAILRDAPVLLLDEATSALDVETERKVLRNIIQKQPNKTCIVTTHRPSVLNMCERVYRVMDTKVTQLSEQEASKMAMDF